MNATNDVGSSNKATGRRNTLSEVDIAWIIKKKTNYGIRQQKHYYIVGRKCYPWVCLGTEELDSIHDGVPMR
jgi:hypothetical protein